MGEDRVPGHAANVRVERREQERKRSLRASVFERAVSRALSYQRAAWMAMPTKTSATITIKAATMMSIVITPSTTECGDQSADGGRGCQGSRLPQHSDDNPVERIHETYAVQPGTRC